MTLSLFHFFLMLGSDWILYILLGCSLLTFGVIFDRWRNLRKQEKVGQLLWNTQISDWLAKGLPKDWRNLALQFFKKYPCVESRLLKLLAEHDLSTATDKRDSVDRMTQSFFLTEKIVLERYLIVLGTLGNSAPFIGLFGTILGIIKAFSELGKAGENAGLHNIGGGLAEALVTTAAGLIVAIPAAIMFNFFQRKIKLISARTVSIGGIISEEVKE